MNVAHPLALAAFDQLKAEVARRRRRAGRKVKRLREIHALAMNYCLRFPADMAARHSAELLTDQLARAERNAARLGA